MDLTWTAEHDAFRSEARTFLERNVPNPPYESGDTHDGFAQHLKWEQLLSDENWAVVSWPQAYGGRDASLWEWLIFEEEYYRCGAPQRVTQNGIFLLAPTIFEFGTQIQQDYYLPRMSKAQDLWCQGWSEPNAGSDLAAITSKAVRDEQGGGWRLTGQKTWTTRGSFCTMMFGLFRTDPNETRHRGLTYFMVPLDAEGVTVRGFGRLDGDEGFAEVFLEDVFVPDGDLDPPRGGTLGEIDNGWGVAMATTSSERGLTLRSPGRFLATAHKLIDAYNANVDKQNDSSRRELARAVIAAEAYQYYTLSDVSGMAEGNSPGFRSSMNKIFWSELDIQLHKVGQQLEGQEQEHDSSAWTKGYQFALSGPIYAGTNEIQRNIVAERVLGLPRK